MTCKDCVKYTECESLAMADFDYAHQMWLNDFWENADKRCKDFKSVKTAHWYINPDGWYPQCTNCWEEPKSRQLEPICPNCGAIMGKDTK